jgi:hypothetical protein
MVEIGTLKKIFEELLLNNNLHIIFLLDIITCCCMLYNMILNGKDVNMDVLVLQLYRKIVQILKLQQEDAKTT